MTVHFETAKYANVEQGFKTRNAPCMCMSPSFPFLYVVDVAIWNDTFSLLVPHLYLSYFPGGSNSKASVYNVRDLGLIPGLGRFPGEGNGNPLQYSCLENPMDRGAWCRLLSMGSQRVGHDWAISLSLIFDICPNGNF